MYAGYGLGAGIVSSLPLFFVFDFWNLCIFLDSCKRWVLPFNTIQLFLPNKKNALIDQHTKNHMRQREEVLTQINDIRENAIS